MLATPAPPASSAHRATSSELMVAIRSPKPTDVMADPAAATCGFPVAVALKTCAKHHPEAIQDTRSASTSTHGLFIGLMLYRRTMLGHTAR